MPLLLKILLLCYAAGVASLAWRTWESVRLMRGERRLRPIAPDDQDWPTLDVVIPVKDEEAHIGACLDSVLSQNYPRLRAIVVNDRSTDGTARVVQEWQNRHPTLERVDIQSLPAGLFGKPHALHSIADRLSAAYVAFIDSDLVLQPGCFVTLIDHMRRAGSDWAIMAGRPILRGFWERLIIPVCGAVALAWYDPRKVSDPAWDNAMGSAFMIARRASYEAIGGHGAVIRSYDEDSALARIAKRAGQRLSFVVATDLFGQRFYGTLRGTLRGMTRTFAGGIKTVPKLLLTINGVNFVGLLPLGVLGLLAIAHATGTSIPWPRAWLAVATVHLACSAVLGWLVYRAAGQRRLFWLMPLGAAMCAVVCVKAIDQLLRGRGVTWRGTTYASGTA